MVWHKKIVELIESADSIELKIYRNRVRENLHKQLNKKREEMLKQDRYPYQGKWLTHDEIVLAMEQERRENISKFMLVVLIYLVLLAGAFFLGFFVWRSAV